MAGPTGYLAPYLVLPATNLSLHPTRYYHATKHPSNIIPTGTEIHLGGANVISTVRA